MAKTSIIINSTDTAGKAAQKTFTDVNPNASNAQLATLGQMLAAVSTNTYNGTTRIDKTDCDTESKTARNDNISISSTSYDGTLARIPLSNLSGNSNIYQIAKDLQSSAPAQYAYRACPLIDNFKVTEGDVTPFLANYRWYSSQTKWYADIGHSAKAPCKYSFDITFPEDELYAQWKKTINVEIYDDSQEG